MGNTGFTLRSRRRRRTRGEEIMHAIIIGIAHTFLTALVVLDRYPIPASLFDVSVDVPRRVRGHDVRHANDVLKPRRNSRLRHQHRTDYGLGRRGGNHRRGGLHRGLQSESFVHGRRASAVDFYRTHSEE